MSDDVLLQAKALLEQANALELELNEFFEREAQQEGAAIGEAEAEAEGPGMTDE